MIMKEFSHGNIKKIIKMSDETIDQLIENSCFQNLQGCEKCNVNPSNETVSPRSWYKGVQMINEALVFDSYVTNLLLDKNFNKKTFLNNLLNVRPSIPAWKDNSISEKRQHFFTMYQDALFKALLPEANLKSIMSEIDNNNLVSLLDAKVHWYIEV